MVKYLTKLILGILVFTSTIVMGAGPVYDPASGITRTLTCSVPLQYTDNTNIGIGDMTEIKLYRKDDTTNVWVQVSSKTDGICSFDIDTSALPEDQYYYAATVVAGNESAQSNIQPIVVRVTRTPKPPSLLTIQ